MTGQSETLLALARRYCEELSQHEVIKPHWQDVSLILKGSTARGLADRYSDIDFVFYSGAETHRQIVDGYFTRGLTKRKDGVFVPLPDWIGHYHFETLGTLEGYFRDRNMPQIWECVNVVVLHDPASAYRGIVDVGMRGLFDRHLEMVKDIYLKLQLTLDWMTHPLQRGDGVAVLLHGAEFVRSACRLCYLLGRKPYPHDKWLFRYMDKEGPCAGIRELSEEYAGSMRCSGIEKDQELESYPQFTKAAHIVGEIKKCIRSLNGDQPWLEEWYLYV